MIGQTVSHYKILEKLGEGGMGVVYKAEDLTLKRTVALKFLPQHLTSTEAEQARFLQEAQAAATLNHPNICTIHAVGEADTPGGGHQRFIDMEYVDGTTLRKRLPFSSFSDAVTIAAQVGEALQEAHAKGIVHRDIKADNIMVNAKGQAKVMDFGLAKLKGSLKLTKTSSTVGTLAYMAPEQIQGGEVDARSDIFSFGIVLFEMLTGKTPFRGEHEAAAMYSIMNEEPDSLLKYRPELSPDLERIIRRALEKDPADRFQSAADMVSELRREQKKSTRVVRSQEMPAAAASAPSAPAAASAPKRKLPLAAIAAGILVLVAAVAAWLLLGRTQERIDSLAVLPFENVGGSAELDYLSDGIAENIINNLAKIQGLRVAPRGAAFRFRGKDVDLADIGTKLNVRAVLTGRIIHRGNALDVQVDLIDVKNVSQLWGNHYQAGMGSLLELQDGIIREVSAKLGQADAAVPASSRAAQNSQAYTLYLQGRYFWNRRTSQGLEQAFGFFRQALALDSTFALAYSGLADCYLLQPQYGGVKSSVAIPLARANALKALSLDNSLAEARTALAFTFTADFDYENAEREYKQALALNPNYPTAYHWYGLMLGRNGRLEEYLRMITRATEIDPYAPVLRLNVGVAHVLLRQYDVAVTEFEKTIALDSTLPLGYDWRGMVRVLQGNPAAAVPDLRRAVELSRRSTEATGLLGFALAKAGERAEALQLLRECEARYAAGTGGAYNVARICVGLGERDSAIAWLQRDLADRSVWITQLYTDPTFEPIRSDPRVAAIFRATGQAH
jgi:serine/threonine-protein kinase